MRESSGVAPFVAVGLEFTGKPGCFAAQFLVHAGFEQFGQGSKPGRHGHGVAAQGARLVHRAFRRNVPHDVRTGCISTHRHAAANDFAKSNDVGLNAV